MGTPGVDLSRVTRLFTERAPCTHPAARCADLLASKIPEAKITYSFEYGASKASRSSGNEAFKSAMEAIGKFLAAGGKK